MKCPCCGAWSLTPDPRRNGWICHVYGAFVPAEVASWRHASSSPR
ncbi:hypothetical protein SEA_FLAGSTAFF_54 [Mycobacterium phage FlagStaff]|uniref:Uncharacterized protein n=1 Tax=Mycobacterium phage FlagStaff TaxID=1647304 RepID=A0A0F6WE27_9CAUD|nr:HTH DNA binding protein [Mycobacterium phage FlagStaff]AKF14491.1 hypothetical protein SEA_FLAGSTAFF_54 [Mycobacterium phage FlagStaff]